MEEWARKKLVVQRFKLLVEKIQVKIFLSIHILSSSINQNKNVVVIFIIIDNSFLPIVSFEKNQKYL